jgi:hypothetical protein
MPDLTIEQDFSSDEKPWSTDHLEWHAINLNKLTRWFEHAGIGHRLTLKTTSSWLYDLEVFAGRVDQPTKKTKRSDIRYSAQLTLKKTQTTDIESIAPLLEEYGWLNPSEELNALWEDNVTEEFEKAFPTMSDGSTWGFDANVELEDEAVDRLDDFLRLIDGAVDELMGLVAAGHDKARGSMTRIPAHKAAWEAAEEINGGSRCPRPNALAIGRLLKALGRRWLGLPLPFGALADLLMRYERIEITGKGSGAVYQDARTWVAANRNDARRLVLEPILDAIEQHFGFRYDRTHRHPESGLFHAFIELPKVLGEDGVCSRGSPGTIEIIEALGREVTTDLLACLPPLPR